MPISCPADIQGAAYDFNGPGMLFGVFFTYTMPEEFVCAPFCELSFYARLLPYSASAAVQGSHSNMDEWFVPSSEEIMSTNE